MELINNEIISNYEKTKKTIYKWREQNREQYLTYNSEYNFKKYNSLSPDEKAEKIEKIKANVKARREKIKLEKLLDGITTKRGRPRKHILEV